ncbi:MAG: VCBS repeat-containing protein [Ekhidna sp.]|nr:VCBS repeat-containing protein [Ekhidna sp.]
MKTNLYTSLLSRLKNKHTKLANRFHKSVKDGEFQKQRYRKRKDAIVRLKVLEKRIQGLSSETGFKVSLNYKHWALALALGVVVASSNPLKAQDSKNTFRDKLQTVVNKESAFNSRSTAQSIRFGSPTSLGLSYLNTLATGDIDNDGDIDAVYVSFTDPPLILENQGDFEFSQSILPSSSRVIIWGANLGDFDGDGDLDLFLTTGSYNEPFNYVMYTNDGAGNFTPETASVDFGSFDNGNLIISRQDFAKAANLDEDGDLEYVAVQIDRSTDQYGLAVFDQTNFNFIQTAQPRGELETYDVLPVAILDVDGDNDLDIAFRSYLENNGEPLQFFLNDGSSNFTRSNNVLS